MKSFIISCLISVMALMSFTCYNSPEKNVADEDKTANNGFAVVELFTSEGCSSCPAADETVAKILKEYKSDVYVLGYHVDYWNNLGWKDVFSNADYSNRQRNYGRIFKLPSVYTPQVVINGEEQFVGSDAIKLHNAINKYLRQAANIHLNINASGKGNSVNVSYKITNTLSNLNVALVQSIAQTKVQRGENSGATLHHINIVREIQIITLKKTEGTVTLSLPRGLSFADCSVIAFTQNINDFKITAAAKANIE